jgi:hypothetical protein
MLGANRSLLYVLLKKHATTPHPLAKRQLESALEHLLRRSTAFQSVTVIHPSYELCWALDDVIKNPEPEQQLETILDFIDESFSRFMQKPYPYYDEVAALFPTEEGIDLFSCILVTFTRQLQYISDRGKSPEKLTYITEWFCNFVFRLVIIGEEPNAIMRLLSSFTADMDRRLSGNITRLSDNIARWVPFSLENTLVNNFLPGSLYMLLCG